MEKTTSAPIGLKKPIVVKLVLVGKLGVGKSAMIVRFLTRRFIGEYDPNIGLIYHHHVKLDNHDVQVDILESGGMDFIESNDVHTSWGDTFILVYAINDRSSFEELPPVRRHLEKVRTYDRPLLMLVGNKKDAESDREVPTQEGQELAEDMNCAFNEVSTAASYEGVESFFNDAIRETMRLKLTQQAVNGIKRSSHSKVMEMVEKNSGRNRAMSSLKETLDEYCATRTDELANDSTADRSRTCTF